MENSSQIAERRGHRPGRPSASESAARIESLLDVAAEVFIERGYKGTSLDEIASRAGASKQTLYTRYPSKSDLFKAVMLRETESTNLRFSGILLSDQPIEMVLEQFGKELIEKIMSSAPSRLLRTLISTVDTFPELAESFWESVSKNGMRILVDYLRVQSKLGVLHEFDTEMAAHVFHGMILGPYFLPAQLGCEPIPALKKRDRYVKEAVRVFLAAYRRPVSERFREKKSKDRRA